MARALAVLLLLATTAQGQVVFNRPTTSFLGGQVSPLFTGRSDLPYVQSGCRELTNMMVIDVGAVTRRPGTIYVAECPDGENVWLEPFIYNESDAYVMEFSHNLVRFYRDTGIVLDGANAYTLATPYDGNDVSGLRFYQSADVCYIVHKDGEYSPRKLVRSGHTSWAITDCNTLIEDGPFLTQNTTTTTVRVDDVNNTVTMVASASIFDSEHVGALWRIDHVMPSQSITGTFTATGESDEAIAGIGAAYAFQFTAAAFMGTIKIQVSYDEGETWTDDYVATNSASAAMDANDSEISDYGQNVLMRVACSDFTSGSVAYELGVDSYVHTGIVRITAYTDANEVTATVLDRVGLADTNTTRWNEGAWSEYQGYPTAVAGHFGRLVFARDLTVWFSVVDDFESFANHFAADDEAFTWSASQARQNPIRWMVGERTQNLICGSLGKVMELRSLDELSGFTPTNPPKVASASSISCGDIVPALAETAILFADRTGCHIHELIYDSGEESVIAPDITQIAGDILGSTSMVQMAFQQTPWPTLWCVKGDGGLASCYYNRVYQIVAWCEHEDGGEDSYKSVAVVPTSGGVDRTWLAVERAGGIYVEYLADLDLVTGERFLDSSVSYDGGDAVVITNISRADPAVVTLAAWPTGLSDGDQVTISSVVGMTEVNGLFFTADDCVEGKLSLTLDLDDGSDDYNSVGNTAYKSGGTLQIVENAFGGLTHLEGETVAVLGDGVYLGTEVVASGTITLDDYYNEVIAGLNYTSTVTPMEIEIAGERGVTSPSVKRVTHLLINAYYMAGGKYGPSSSTLHPLNWGQATGGSVSSPGYRWTGPYTFNFVSGPKHEATFTIVQDEPYPMTLRSVVPVCEMGN
jgi:hypothetical protein